jgi:hypothetical protein
VLTSKFYADDLQLLFLGYTLFYVHKGFGYAITAQSKSFFVFLDTQFYCKKTAKTTAKR